jgi:hypothetical protein
MMKKTLRFAFLLALLSASLTAGCSPPEAQNGQANANVPGPEPQSSPSPGAVNSNVPSVSVQPLANSNATAKPIQPDGAPHVVPSTKPAAGASESAASGPKLAVLSTEAELDFGKQAQDKTITRSIKIKNTGNEDLKIDSVVPG